MMISIRRLLLLLYLYCSLINQVVANDAESLFRSLQDEEQSPTHQDAAAAAAALPEYVRNVKPSYSFNDLEKAQNEADYRDHQNGRRYIVKYKKKFAASPAGRSDSAKTKLASKQNNILLESTKLISLEMVNADVVMLHSESQLLQLQSDENVELVEIDQKFYMTEDPTKLTKEHPESFYNFKKGIRDLVQEGDTIPYGIDMVNATLVGAKSVSNRKVCVIDSGFDHGHSDLQRKNVAGSTTYEENLPWDEDTNGHGTHVVGTIAALDNGWGVVGVIPNGDLNIHIVRVFGSGSYWVWGSDLATALYECADADADIINLSLGSSSYSAFIANACKDINENRNVLIVASAGNYGYSGYHYPASYDNVMSVAAVDNTTAWASFNNYNDKVDIAAPGVDVYSTLPRPFGSFGYASGTSMAAPHVSGVAALVWSRFPSLSAIQIQRVLELTATDLGSTGRDNFYGYGLIDAKAAYDYLANGNTFNPTSSPTGIECVEGKKKFDLKIIPDNYDYTTTWELREACTEDLVLSGVEEDEGIVFCISESKNYVFTIKDSFGAGLCCSYGIGAYTLYYDGVLIQSGGDFDDEESFSFGVGSDSCSPSLAPTPMGPTSPPTGLECDDGKKKFDLKVIPDDDYYDATWSLTKTCTGETVLSGVDEGIVACLDDLEYNFTISEYNGLCCYYGLGYYEIFYDKSFVKSGGSFDYNEIVSFGSSTAQTCAPTMAPTETQCEDGKKKFDLNLTPDDYPWQTTWKLRSACSGEVVLEGDGYSNGETACLEDLEYNFTIYDYNGICCWYGEGSYEVYYDGSFIKSGGDFDDYETVKFGSSTAETCSPTISPTIVENCPNGTKKFAFEMIPDNYPYRIDWWLRYYDTQIVIESGNGDIQEMETCLANDNTIYEFVIKDTWDRGLCCTYGDGSYSIYYDGNLLRTGSDFGHDDFTLFGMVKETLTLGFVGVSSELDDEQIEQFEFQTAKFVEAKAEEELGCIGVDSATISVSQSILMPGIHDGIQSYRRLLKQEQDRSGSSRSLHSYGDGLLVDVTVTAVMHSRNGEVSIYKEKDWTASNMFAINWYDFETMVVPIMSTNSTTNSTGLSAHPKSSSSVGSVVYESSAGSDEVAGAKNNGGTNGMISMIILVGTVIVTMVLLVLTVMVIKVLKEARTLEEVVSSIRNVESWEDNISVERKSYKEIDAEEMGFEEGVEGGELK